MSPLKLSDLPPSPPVHDGKSELLVLAYPMTEDHIAWWARKHHIEPHPHPFDKSKIDKDHLMTQVVIKMRHLLPREIQIATVFYESGDDGDFAWAIAFNTRNGLERAGNLELIENVRKIVGASGPPQWYEPDFYED